MISSNTRYTSPFIFVLNISFRGKTSCGAIAFFSLFIEIPHMTLLKIQISAVGADLKQHIGIYIKQK